MTLPDCLESLHGYGVVMQRRGSRLVIQSATVTPSDEQKATLQTHKPLLLTLLPDGAGYPPGAVLDAVEAYQERQAIMLDSGDMTPATVETVALSQAQAVLGFCLSPNP